MRKGWAFAWTWFIMIVDVLMVGGSREGKWGEGGKILAWRLWFSGVVALVEVYYLC
jgi:hypothetical protein